MMILIYLTEYCRSHLGYAKELMPEQSSFGHRDEEQRSVAVKDPPVVVETRQSLLDSTLTLD